MLYTLTFLILAGIMSISTAYHLISNIPIIPVSGSSSEIDIFEVTAHSSNRDIQKLLKKFDMEVPGVTPSLAWLFGFPQSGSAYLFHVLHVVTKTATATNYGHNVMDLKGVVHISKHDSVRVYKESGPALLSYNVLKPPETRILTWASTDGACRNCHPRKYMYNYARFRELCWEGSIVKEGKQLAVEYNPEYVKSAVHLFRDPYDNILLRFQAEREEMAMKKHEAWLQLYPSSSEGFQSWCMDRDSEWYDVEKAWYGEDTMQLAEGVICRQEFYKYVMYHNNVVRTRLAYHLPTLVLKYEDFFLQYEDTIEKLVKFLELPVSRSPPEQDVQVGFSKLYYTEKNREATNAFMMSLALPKVEIVLREYIAVEQIIDKMQSFDNQLA